MPSPIVYPLTRGAKYFFQAAGIAWTIYEHLHDSWDYNLADMTWRRCLIVCQRGEDDDAVTSMDLLNVTGGAIDNTWTTGDFANCENQILTFLTAWKPYLSTSHGFSELRWYRMQFAPASDPKPYIPSVIPERVTPITVSGLANDHYLPKQTSQVLREVVTVPRHHGRLYMPMDALETGLDNSGQLPAATVSAQINALSSCYTNLMTLGFWPVVPSLQKARDVSRVLQSVVGVQADSVPDIQRRRRPNAAHTDFTVHIA